MKLNQLLMWRLRHNLTGEQASELLGCAPSTLSQYENNNSPIPADIVLLLWQYDEVEPFSIRPDLKRNKRDKQRFLRRMNEMREQRRYRRLKGA